jgi:hypothetical protein
MVIDGFEGRGIGGSKQCIYKNDLEIEIEIESNFTEQYNNHIE